MLTLGTIESALVADDNKTVRWSIRIFDTDGVGYGYYTDAIGADGWATDEAWTTGEAWFDGITNDIVLMDWNGIELRRNSSESGIMAPSDVTFTVSNPGNVYDFTKFKGGEVFIELFLWNATYGERKIQGWKFTIKTCEPGYQKLRFTCEDFLQKYLRGDYPNTRLPEDVFPSNRTYTNTGLCVPVPFGTAYVPLRDVYVEKAVQWSYLGGTLTVAASANGSRCKITDSGNGFGSFSLGNPITTTAFSNAANNGTFSPLKVSAGEIEFDTTTGLVNEVVAGGGVLIEQDQQFFMLGDPSYTYAITKIHAPKDPFGNSEWTLTGVTAPQSTHVDADANSWRMFQAIISDQDQDGTNDTAGFFVKTPTTYDPIVQFTRSDTLSTTNPADIIAFVQKDMGIPAADIDEAGTFLTCHATFDGYAVPLTFNGAFWYKQPREKVLSQLLTQCHSCIDVGETLQLRVLSKTSRSTITDADILRNAEQGEGTFTYRDIVNEDYSDSVYVAWQQSGQPQDSFLKVIVSADAAANVIPKDVLECQFVQDSQDIQRVGRLHAQRKFGKVATISFLAKSNQLALQPDDVITISDANYGGTYNVLIDSVKINKDCSINFSCTKFSYSFDDWNDLNPTALAPPTDTSTLAWQPTISGPQTDQDIGRSAFDTWGKEYLTVGPVENKGKFTDIQQALNAVNQAGGGAIYILDGTYQMTAPLYVPDVNLEVVGQSRGGVILRNLAASDLFILHNLSKTYSFRQFTIEEQTSGYGFWIYGDADANNTANVDLSLLTLTGFVSDAIRLEKGQTGKITILNNECTTTGSRFFNTDVDTNSLDINISNNRITQTGTGAQYGITAYASKMICSGNLIIQNAETGQTLIPISLTGSIVAVNNNISAVISTGGDSMGSVFRGISVGTSNSSIITGNIISCTHSTAKSATFRGIFISNASSASGIQLIGNNVDLTASASTSADIIGVYTAKINDSVFSGNRIKLSAPSCVAQYHIGMNITTSDRNTISGNNIDVVNNTAQDFGIILDANSDNNQGGDNITYNCGTGISDAGAGNAVTGKDI